MKIQNNNMLSRDIISAGKQVVYYSVVMIGAADVVTIIILYSLI